MEKTKLRFNSLKEYDNHLESLSNDKQTRLRKLHHTLRNRDSNEIMNELSYLVKTHNYSFEDNVDYLSEYLFNNEFVDEIVLRMLLSMKHVLNKNILTQVLYKNKVGLLSSDICDLFHESYEKQKKEKGMNPSPFI